MGPRPGRWSVCVDQLSSGVSKCPLALLREEAEDVKSGLVSPSWHKGKILEMRETHVPCPLAIRLF